MKYIFSISILLLSFSASAQIKLSWELLSDVEFKSTYFEEHATNYLVPTFGEGPKAFDGKEVIISGYFIPLSKDAKRFVLSKSPYASCFFCGKAGPETVVEVVVQEGHSKMYKLDTYLNMKGTLQLNADDLNHFNYILKDAQSL